MPDIRKPWFKFYAQDWLADPVLRGLPLAAQGLLINMMALAHNGTPYGYLSDSDGRPIDLRKALNTHGMQTRCSLDTLLIHGRCKRDTRGILYIPRMVKDAAYSLAQSELGKRGGNPTLKAPFKPEQSRADTEQSRAEIDCPPARAGMKIAEAQEWVSRCHPDFARVPVMGIEQALLAFRHRFPGGALDATGAQALNDMALHYAGARMVKPLGHLSNYLNGRTGKRADEPGAGGDRDEWKAAMQATADAVWEAKRTGSSVKRVLRACRDKFRDCPKLDGKDAVTCGADLAMNNERPK